jgi:hypothetical protein
VVEYKPDPDLRDTEQVPLPCTPAAIVWALSGSMLNAAYNMGDSPAPYEEKMNHGPGPLQRRRSGRLGRAAGNGHRTPESLFDRPIVSVKEVQEVTGTTYAAAKGLVARLARLGILVELTGYSRNRRFRYEPYVRLFSEEPAEAET